MAPPLLGLLLLPCLPLHAQERDTVEPSAAFRGKSHCPQRPESQASNIITRASALVAAVYPWCSRCLAEAARLRACYETFLVDYAAHEEETSGDV